MDAVKSHAFASTEIRWSPIMSDPIIMEIATAVASQTAQALSSQATRTLAEIVKRITSKFRDHPTDQAILNNAQAASASTDVISQLADALHRAARDDPDFGREITALWKQTRPESNTATSEGVVNTFHGSAARVVQMRDVHGDLTIN
jgi:pantoate kinase